MYTVFLARVPRFLLSRQALKRIIYYSSNFTNLPLYKINRYNLEIAIEDRNLPILNAAISVYFIFLIIGEMASILSNIIIDLMN